MKVDKEPAKPEHLDILDPTYPNPSFSLIQQYELA